MRAGEDGGGVAAGGGRETGTRAGLFHYGNDKHTLAPLLISRHEKGNAWCCLGPYRGNNSINFVQIKLYF